MSVQSLNGSKTVLLLFLSAGLVASMTQSTPASAAEGADCLGIFSESAKPVWPGDIEKQVKAEDELPDLHTDPVRALQILHYRYLTNRYDGTDRDYQRYSTEQKQIALNAEVAMHELDLDIQNWTLAPFRMSPYGTLMTPEEAKTLDRDAKPYNGWHPMLYGKSIVAKLAVYRNGEPSKFPMLVVSGTVVPPEEIPANVRKFYDRGHNEVASLMLLKDDQGQLMWFPQLRGSPDYRIAELRVDLRSPYRKRIDDETRNFERRFSQFEPVQPDETSFLHQNVNHNGAVLLRDKSTGTDKIWSVDGWLTWFNPNKGSEDSKSLNQFINSKREYLRREPEAVRNFERPDHLTERNLEQFASDVVNHLFVITKDQQLVMIPIGDAAKLSHVQILAIRKERSDFGRYYPGDHHPDLSWENISRLWLRSRNQNARP